MKNEVYAYLARRDKQGVKFIGSFGYDSKIYPTKINEENLRLLNMDPQTSAELQRQINENRMEYELFLETANSFEEIRSSLSGRGYTKIPSHQFSSGLKPGMLNENVLVTKGSTMMRRGSNIR